MLISSAEEKEEYILSLQKVITQMIEKHKKEINELREHIKTLENLLFEIQYPEMWKKIKENPKLSILL